MLVYIDDNPNLTIMVSILTPPAGGMLASADNTTPATTTPATPANPTMAAADSTAANSTGRVSDLG